MTQNTEQLQVIPDPGLEATSLSHPIQTVARFLRIVLFRREILIVTVIAAALLGGLYYATATRIYEANASLLLLQMGDHDTAASVAGERVAKDLMPTYTSIATSEAVLIEALKILAPEHRNDFSGVSRSSWPKVLRDNLSLSAMRGTNILSITYRSKDPQAAAAVVDAVLSAYLAYMNELYASTAGEVADLLGRELKELDEDYIKKSQEKHRIRSEAQELALKDGEKGVNVVVARAIELNNAWMEAQQQRVKAQSQLTALQYAVQRGEDLQQYAIAMLESVGNEYVKSALGISTQDAYMTSQSMQQLLKEKAALNSMRQVYGPNHRSVREKEERIRVTEQYLNNRSDIQIATAERASNERLAPMLFRIAQQELEQAAILEQNLRASYDAERMRALELDESASALQTVEDDLAHLLFLKQALVEQLAESDLSQGNEMLKTRIINKPEVPKAPANPRLAKTFAIALFLGVAVGLGVIYILDLLDDRFRSPEEMQMQLGVPILAMVRKLEPLDQVGPGGIHVNVEPTGVEAESFRTLRTALAFAAGGANRLVVTSTEPGDGKTTISVNLGTTIAQSGKRTLLIDADMRRPGLTPLVNLRGQRGLSTILRDSAPIIDSIGQNLVKGFLQNLDVIPSGPRPVNPMELLASDRFSDLLAWAETVYDQIVVDSPPVLAVSDSAIIGRLVDGVVLTVRPEKNRRRLVVRAVESFPPLGVNILGLVINNVDADKNQDGYGYGYGYAYDYGHDGGSEPTGEEHERQRPRRVTNEAA
jgi:polysaccharide biosynthesis transport protein